MTEDELNLWKRLRQGDEAARQELILSHLYLTEVLAKRMAKIAGWANWEDLRQDGVIGLIKATTKFDESRGVPFRFFARDYIRGAILDSSELTRALARRQEEAYRKVRRAEEELTKMLRRNPTIEEVAEKTQLTIEQIQNAIDAVGLAFAGEFPDAEDWPALNRVEAAQPERTLLIQGALSQLDPREGLIVTSYYLEDQSHPEIATRLGMTVSNVTKIRQRAIVKLRELLG